MIRWKYIMTIPVQAGIIPMLSSREEYIHR